MAEFDRQLALGEIVVEMKVGRYGDQGWWGDVGWKIRGDERRMLLHSHGNLVRGDGSCPACQPVLVEESSRSMWKSP